MSGGKLLILILFGVAVAGTMVVSLLDPDGNTTGVDQARAARIASTGKVLGISLQLNDARNTPHYRKYIDEIAHAGANTICLSVAGYQENGASTSIFIDARKVPPDKDLTGLIDYAHKQGLRVVLMPIVLLENPRGGEWRGKINPPDWNDWWEDYTNFVMHYVWIADGAKAEIFIVGSELITTERQTDRWKALIKRVRKHYGGLLCYSANWDHYDVPKFWSDLDIVGMTTYYDLTGGKAPTVERLVQAWIPLKKDILAWQAEVKRPLLFTEVGWPNQTTCGQYPWDYYRAADKPDPQAQANCFEAFFRTWHDQKNVIGFLVWEWRNYPGQKTGPKDPSYVPHGKPAMNVIKRYYAAGRKATSQPTTQITGVKVPDRGKPASTP